MSIKSLVLTVFLLWLTIQINFEHEVYLAYFFVLTVGILHGANDISLIQYLTKSGSKSITKYLLFYISVVAVTSVLFFLVPIFALTVFVLVSCFHFGEQHFYKSFNYIDVKARSFFVAYGSLIFGLMFYFNISESSNIIFELTTMRLTDSHFLYFLIGSIVFFIVSIVSNLKKITANINYKRELFLLLILSIIFKLATLLWAFAIYFIVWHSIPSLTDQSLKLYGKFTKKNFLKYIKASLPNWIVSIIGLCLVYYISTQLDLNFIALFFAFLAAITIPHVIVMYYLNR